MQSLITLAYANPDVSIKSLCQRLEVIHLREHIEELRARLARHADQRNTLCRQHGKAKDRRFTGEPLTGFGDSL